MPISRLVTIFDRDLGRSTLSHKIQKSSHIVSADSPMFVTTGSGGGGFRSRDGDGDGGGGGGGQC